MDTTVVYEVPTISCGHCKGTIEGGLAELEGVVSGTVEIEAKTVTVVGSADTAAVLEMLDDLGYPATITAA